MGKYILIVLLTVLMSGCDDSNNNPKTDDTAVPSSSQIEDTEPIPVYPLPTIPQEKDTHPISEYPSPVPQTEDITADSKYTQAPPPDTSLYIDVHNKYEKLKSDFKFLDKTDYVVQKKALDISKELNIQKAGEISASLYYDKNNELKAAMFDPFFANPKIVLINIYYQDDDRFVEIRTVCPFEDNVKQETMVYALSNGEVFDISRGYGDDVYEAVVAENESDYNNLINLALKPSLNTSYSGYSFMLVSDDYFDWAPWIPEIDTNGRSEWGYWYDKCPFYDLYFMLLDSNGNILQYFLVDKHILGTGGMIGSNFLLEWNEIPDNAVSMRTSWYAGGGEQYTVIYDEDKQEVGILKRFLYELGQEDEGEPFSKFIELYRINLDNMDKFAPEEYDYELRKQYRQIEELVAAYLNAVKYETAENPHYYRGTNGERFDIFCSGKYPDGGYEVFAQVFARHEIEANVWVFTDVYRFYVDLETGNIYDLNTRELLY